MDVCEIIEVAISLEKQVTDHLLSVHSCARGELTQESDSVKCNTNPTCQTACTGNAEDNEDPHVNNFNWIS